MSFSSVINLGTFSPAITKVKLSACTGSTCDNPVVITGYDNYDVWSGTKTISGIPDTTNYIKVEALGTCADTIQCLQISGKPGTPTPTPTATPTVTPTPTPTITSTPTGGGVQITNCVRLVKDDAIASTDCSSDRVQRHEVTLYDPTGANIQNAPYDITVTLSGTTAGQPSTWTLVILSGTNSAYEDIVTREFPTCGNKNGMIIRYVSGITAVSPTNIGQCSPAPTPTGGVTLNRFYYGQGLSTAGAHCGIDYSISASFFSAASTISELFNGAIYTTADGTTAFNGLGNYYPVSLTSGTSTLNGLYNAIKINSNGFVEDLVFVNGGCSENPY